LYIKILILHIEIKIQAYVLIEKYHHHENEELEVLIIEKKVMLIEKE